MFTLANELLRIESETDGRDGSWKAFPNAQLEKTRDGHVRELGAFGHSSETRKSELLQVRDECMVEREQTRTERDENASRCHDVLSAVRYLVLDNTSGEGTLEEAVSKLQLL